MIPKKFKCLEFKCLENLEYEKLKSGRSRKILNAEVFKCS